MSILPDEMLLHIARSCSSATDAKNMLLAHFDEGVMISEMRKRKDCLVLLDEYIWDLESPLPDNVVPRLTDEMLLHIANTYSSPAEAKEMLHTRFGEEVMVAEMKKRMKKRKDCLVFFDEYVWDLKTPIPYDVMCRLPDHVMDAMIDWLERVVLGDGDRLPLVQ